MFKYRGKNLKGEWVKGSKLKIANSVFIVPENTKWVKILDCSHIHCDSIVEIDPSTLGVCWGMKDKNGKDVFTGMKVRGNQHSEIVGVVVFDTDCAMVFIESDVNKDDEIAIANICEVSNIEIIEEE